MSQHVLRSLLETIADGRDVDAQVVQRLRQDDPVTANLIGQVDARLARLRRRDNEFAAVIAMTHDLVAKRSGSLLQSIVDRAHELLGSDITYVSAFNATDRSFEVRAVNGVVSPGFLGMIVPPGVGIATLVVESMAPAWVDDYFAAAGFPHDGRIDDVLRTEQVSSILGVPLIADQRILGVLFVADRRQRRYSPEDISLARSFADHAAIVLEQSQLVAELHATSRRAQLVAEDVRRASALHEHLTGLVAGGSDPEDVAAALAETLGRRIAVVDADAHPFAGSADLVDGSDELRDALARVTNEATSVSLETGCVDYVAAIVVQQRAAGALLVERSDRALTKWDKRSIERSGIAFALLWMQQRAADIADERIRGELANELTDARGNRQYAIDRVRARGLNPARPWTLAHFATTSQAADRLLAALRNSPEILVTQTHGLFWALTPTPDGASGLADRIRRAFAESAGALPLTVTTSAASLDALLDDIESVAGVRRMLVGMGETSGVFQAASFAPYAVLFDGDGSRAAAFIGATLQPLIDYDAKRGTDLFGTLLASLDEQGQVAGIARRLGLHPNTVRQRLDRIGMLLPAEWRLPDARFRLETAVRLEAARRAITT